MNQRDLFFFGPLASALNTSQTFLVFYEPRFDFFDLLHFCELSLEHHFTKAVILPFCLLIILTFKEALCDF